MQLNTSAKKHVLAQPYGVIDFLPFGLQCSTHFARVQPIKITLQCERKANDLSSSSFAIIVFFYKHTLYMNINLLNLIN